MKRALPSRKFHARRLAGRRNYERVKLALGFAREDHMSILLQAAKDAGVIKDFWKTKRGGWQDVIRKWDFVIIDLGGNQHPLQTKSSERDAEYFRKNNPETPVFVVKIDEPCDESFRRLGKIFPFFKKFKPA